MALPSVGTPINVTATGDIGRVGEDKALLGFYVNSTAAGTIVLRAGGSGGTVLSGTITPAIGYHTFPASCPGGLHVTIGATLNVTLFIVPGVC